MKRQLANSTRQQKPPDPNNPLHSVIQRQVLKLLTWHGFFVFPNIQSALSYDGISDLTAIKDGITYWIEIKRPKGDRQSDYQKDFQADVESHGGRYLIIHSFDEAQVLVEKHKKEVRANEDHVSGTTKETMVQAVGRDTHG